MKIYNFSAGPSCLPESVLKSVSKASKNFQNSGMSIMEISHRSELIVDLFENTTLRLRKILNVPDNYHILWLQGGASMQFAMVPLNLLGQKKSADYIETGIWSSKAILECNKVGKANVIASSKDSKFTFIPREYEQNIESEYLHITSNNTIYGTQYKVIPNVENPNGFLVADMSSEILSKPLDVSNYGLIYSGAQKNMGPAGVTLVIIREDLVGRNYRDLPTMLDYKTHVSKDSMFNTPPVLSVFAVNETLKWIESIGGITEMEKINNRKAQSLYDEIERNSLFFSPINKDDRSMMNVPFIFKDTTINESEFLSYCHSHGLMALKGHRSVGGFRASIYNSMPEAGVNALISAMQEFEKMGQ